MTATATDTTRASWWRTTWPLTGTHAQQLVSALLAVVAVGALVGFVLTDWTAPNVVTETDRDLARQLAENRTGSRTSLATWGSRLSDTLVKIVATALVTGVMVWRWRRWHEALFVVLTLVFEATAFIAITTIVGRPRPEVERLLESPVNSSFPSGHVAAATVYAAFAVVVFWHSRSRWWRGLAVAVAALLPVIVAWARMYQGMHHLSDVVAGVALGLVSLVICAGILGPPAPRDPAGGRLGSSLVSAGRR